MNNLYKFYHEFCDKQVQTGQYIPEYYEWLRWYKPVPQQLWTPSIIQEELKSKVSHSERSTPPPLSTPILPNFVDSPHAMGCPPPPMGSPRYMLKYTPHTTWVNIPPSVGFPFLPHSMQRGELHQIFTVSPMQQFLCNSIQNHSKIASFNMFD